jgi:hypothetical protein
MEADLKVRLYVARLSSRIRSEIRPQIPTASALTIVNLDPAATWPQ